MPNLLRNASGDIITRRGFQKSPTYLKVSKNILARESIFRNVDCNCNIEQQQSNIKKMPAILTDVQIKQSSIYHRLLLRIQTTKRKQEEERVQHQRRMRWIEEELKKTKEKIRQDKLGLWEVRNQTMELEEVLEEEVEEYQELWNMLNEQIMIGTGEQFIEGEGDDNQYDEDQEDQDQQIEQQQLQQTRNYHHHHHNKFHQEQYQDDSQSQNQYLQQQQEGSSSRYPPSQCTQSKPTCSIKLMQTDRSINSPDQQKMHIMSELTPFENRSHLTQIQNSMIQQQQSQQDTTHSKIISFKKQQSVFNHNT